MKDKKKVMIITGIILSVLALTLGLTYAAYTYARSGQSSSLVLGDIYMYYRETKALTIEDAMPGADYSKYFEFTITGKNTYTKKDIWYDFVLTRGDLPEGKTEDDRIPDEYLKFKLVSVVDEVESVLLEDKTYNDLTSQRIYVETIGKNTANEVNRKYRLYMTVDESLSIGNGDVVFTLDEWNEAFASVKLNVTGDFVEKELPLDPTFVDVVKSKYGTDTSLVAINTDGDLYDGTGEIREYRYSGATANNYVFFDTNGDGVKTNDEIWRIIGIFKDTVKDANGDVINDASGNPTYEEKVKLVRNTDLSTSELPTSNYYLIDEQDYILQSNGILYWNNLYGGTSNNNWPTAGLQYFLNTEQDEYETPASGYLSLLSQNAKQLISLTTYNLGNVDPSTSTAKLSYQQERDGERIWTDNSATWNGLIGLMYPSDYGYSANNAYWETPMSEWENSVDGTTPITTSWFYQTFTSVGNWFISPSSTSATHVTRFKASGKLDERDLSDKMSAINYVSPVLSLKPYVMITDAEGTAEEPYVVVVE